MAESYQTSRLRIERLEEEHFASWFYDAASHDLACPVAEVQAMPVAYLAHIFSDYFRFGVNAKHINTVFSTIKKATHYPYSPLYDLGLWECYSEERKKLPQWDNFARFREKHTRSPHLKDISLAYNEVSIKINSIYLDSKGSRRRFAGEAIRLTTSATLGLLLRPLDDPEEYHQFVDMYEQCFEVKAHPDDSDFVVRPKVVDPDLEYLTVIGEG